MKVQFIKKVRIRLSVLILLIFNALVSFAQEGLTLEKALSIA